MRQFLNNHRGGVRGVGLASALLLPLLATLLPGCGESPSYDAAIRYPLRADPLVIEPPSEPPTGQTPPGKLDASIRAFAGRPGAVILDPATLSEATRGRLQESLDSLFGTPAAPTLGDVAGDAVPGLALDAATLAAGARGFSTQCAHCHGLAGDGRGPSGPWLFPHPRDFRQGVFKTGGGAGKPAAARLMRVLREGVPGSAMPQFDLLPESEVGALVAYAVHLSMRGEVEFRLTRGLLDSAGELDDADIPAAAREALGNVVAAWRGVRVSPAQVVPEPTAESVRRGHALFRGSQVACWGCHTDYGRGDRYRYDVWGSAVRIPDLTLGEWRWGRSPADLAAKVRHGIPGARMPAHPALTDAEVADLVNFVREAGQPQRLPPDVRAALYPDAK